MEKKTRAATESGVLIAIVAAILVALNFISAVGFYKRWDRTSTEKFTLSRGSANLLGSLKQTLYLDIYVTRGLPKLDAFVRDLRDLMQEYKAAGGEKFQFQIIEATDEEQKKAAEEAGLRQVPFGEASETEQTAAVAQGFMGIVFKYGSEKDKIEYLPPERTDGLEFWITNKIREVRDRGDDIKHKIGVLTGVDEIKLSDTNLLPSNMGRTSLQQIITQYFPFYSIQEVDLKDGDGEVPDDLDGLLITQPGKELPEKALRRIDQFLMKGKSLAIVASAVNVKANDATMQAELSTQGLDKLLDGYGIELRRDAVLDFGRSYRVNVFTQGSIASVRFPQVLAVEEDPRFTGDEQLLDTSFPAFFRISSVTVPFASSLVLHKDKQPEAKSMSVVARSTPRSVRVQGERADLRPFQRWQPKGEWQQYDIAAQVEGTLKSAFPAGSGDAQGIEVPEKSKAPARVFVLASAQYLTNPFARAGNAPDMGQMGMMMPMPGDEKLLQLAGPYAQQALTATILSFKNMLDWMTGDTDLLAVSAKILTEPQLVYGDVSKPTFDPNETDEQVRKREDELRAARKSTQQRISWFLTLAPPLLFAAYGVLRWRMRLARRENVSLA
jgi:ABC-type uncharacterized transport system involved in gliding motility auxiliary subunit